MASWAPGWPTKSRTRRIHRPKFKVSNGDFDRLQQLADEQDALERAQLQLYHDDARLFLKAHQSGLICLVNPAWAQLGWSESELLNRLWLNLIHPADMSQVMRNMTDMLSGPISGRVLRMRAKDGSYRRVCWNASRWTATGICFALGEVLA